MKRKWITNYTGRIPSARGKTLTANPSRSGGNHPEAGKSRSVAGENHSAAGKSHSVVGENDSVALQRHFLPLHPLIFRE
ncbi:MAG: hypothetical protein Q3M24_07415 [Candidatus Electrothrix aestuarii]|uniref:Uncharacterized protein n=1 Tax=Candidatus Electrothrix aestuarii TaxID=3062594 RepID=A0AAU8M006_9BACT|nr:hypothetical protein [Candidatus Electrothrix aestuarii]